MPPLQQCGTHGVLAVAFWLTPTCGALFGAGVEAPLASTIATAIATWLGALSRSHDSGRAQRGILCW